MTTLENSNVWPGTGTLSRTTSGTTSTSRRPAMGELSRVSTGKTLAASLQDLENKFKIFIFSVLLPDGRIQTVTYSVAPNTGFVVS